MDGHFRSAKMMQDRLSAAGIASVVIGELAVAVWTDRRPVDYVDLKLSLRPEDAARLVVLLDHYGYRWAVSDPLETLRGYGILRVRDVLGNALALRLCQFDLDETELERGVDVALGPLLTLRVATAEDLVLYGFVSERPEDRTLAYQVVRAHVDRLDLAYVCLWLSRMEDAFQDRTLLALFAIMHERARTESVLAS